MTDSFLDPEIKAVRVRPLRWRQLIEGARANGGEDTPVVLASSDLNRIRVGRNLASSLEKSKRRVWFVVISARRSETGSGVAYSDKPVTLPRNLGIWEQEKVYRRCVGEVEAR